MTDEADTGLEQYLSFLVAGEEYAARVLQVREIVRYEAVTRVPGSARFVRGVMNLRGSVVPVVDLAVKLGLGQSPVTKWTCVVILELAQDGEPLPVGLLCDAVCQVLDLAPSDIEAPPAFGTRMRVDYLRGMVRSGKKFALLLDLDRAFAEDELAAAAQAAAPAPEAPAPEAPAQTEAAPAEAAPAPAAEGTPA